MTEKFDFPLGSANNINFQIIVPSTRDRIIPIKGSTFNNRINETILFVSKLFDGATVEKSIGTYQLKGKIIKEKVAIISVYTTSGRYNRYDLKIKKFLLDKKKAWGQDSMGYVYEEKLYFV